MYQIEITEEDIANKTCYGVNLFEVEFVLKRTNFNYMQDISFIGCNIIGDMKIDEHCISKKHEFLSKNSNNTIFQCKF